VSRKVFYCLIEFRSSVDEILEIKCEIDSGPRNAFSFILFIRKDFHTSYRLEADVQFIFQNARVNNESTLRHEANQSGMI
jgi:hypothetical protein